MISISNLLFDQDLKPKTKIIKRSPALNQGEKFKKYQNSLEKEGFDNMNFDKNGLTFQTNKVINENNFSNDQEIINNLRDEYQKTLKDYEELISKLDTSTRDYLSRVNQNNPYLEKVIIFPDGSAFYVTKQGVAKWIPDMDIWNTLNIPKDYTNLNIPWSYSYNQQVGKVIPSNPPLIIGTPLKAGQSVGNEGSNVFVSNLIDKNNVDDIPGTYMGCYATSPNNDNMRFIGNAPPPPSINVSIINGKFERPELPLSSSKQYGNINPSNTDTTSVPGWIFNGGILMNNDWGYPFPGPAGKQWVCFWNQYCRITQIIKLYTNDTYNLTFYAVGRACCENPNVGNPIDVELYDENMVLISKIFTANPIVNTWTQFSVDFKVQTNKTYKLSFVGTNVVGNGSDKSSAIQGINITNQSNIQPGYTYDDCKLAAVRSGNRYFALQNTNNNLGFCAVSNSDQAIKQYGAGVKQTLTQIWSSNTANGELNAAQLIGTGQIQIINSINGTLISYINNTAENCENWGTTLIKTATYGGNCNNVPIGNVTKIVSDSFNCNYTGSCLIPMSYQKLGGDPAYGCPKNFDIDYTCGGKQFTKHLNFPEGQTLTIDCNQHIQENCVFFFILQDDGNMCIYRGKDPSDIKGSSVWCAMTNGKQKAPNPNWVASKGKYGRNYLKMTEFLAPDEWIGSTDGSLKLIMQKDGNLVLYTSEINSGCKSMANNKMGGDVGINAAYDIGKATIPQNMGLIGLVDEDSVLHVYPSNNQKKQNTYSTIVQNVASWAYDISPFNGSLESCKQECNSKDNCAGFSYNRNNTCWLKNKGMYPFYESNGNAGPVSHWNLDTYIRDQTPNSTPVGISQNTNNIDSIKYEKYLKGGALQNKYGLSNITDVQKQQLGQMETKLNLLTKQINDFTSKYGSGASIVENQLKTNDSGLDNYVEDLNKTNTNIISVAGKNQNGIQNLLKDSDIVVLQKNYDYLFWSILAAGTVLVSMNIIKKQ
jgi:hypothetical protein